MVSLTFFLIFLPPSYSHRNLFSPHRQKKPAWSSKYPQSSPDVSALPQEWTDALNAAVAAGKIPSYAPSTSTGGNPTYADGLDPTGSEVCSGTYKCRIDGQIWDAPDGTVGISFDDGPVDVSTFLCLGVELISGVIGRVCTDLVSVNLDRDQLCYTNLCRRIRSRERYV